MTEQGREKVEMLDRQDPLASFRHQFDLPEGVIYLDGNSLGARPIATSDRLNDVVCRQWGNGLIRSWNDADWFDLPVSLGRKIARIIGAKSNEVVVTDSTGINLFKALSCSLQLQTDRRIILIEADNFPTNHYMVQGLVNLFDNQYEIRLVDPEQLSGALDEDAAVVCLTQVHYKSGRLLDLRAVTDEVHEAGALVVWDLSHSAGVVELAVGDSLVDFAVGCTYKYLNGGPGSPAYLYVAERHHNKVRQPLTGWWGHENPFGFEQTYRPAEGIVQMLTGTQPIVSMALAEIGIDISIQADIKLVREKSKQLTQIFIERVDERCAAYGIEIASPRNAECRGSQVSLVHEQGYAIMQALIDHGVIGDFRDPDNLRFGFSPLYTRYVDVWDAVETLCTVMASAQWQEPKYQQRSRVT